MGILDEGLAEDEEMFVTLTLEDDTEAECRVLTIFEVNDQDYIAMIPVDDDYEDNEEGEVYIYRYFEDAKGNPSMENIESDEEFQMASEAFDSVMEEDDEEDAPDAISQIDSLLGDY